MQVAVPTKPHPRGSIPCPGGCNTGNCQYDIGICMCPAGWTGAQCTQPQKRPCTKRARGREDPFDVPTSNIDPITKEDLNWTQRGEHVL